MKPYIVDYSTDGLLTQAHIFADSPTDAISKLGTVDKIYSVDECSVKLPFEQVIDMLGEYVGNYHTQQFVIAALEYFDLIGR